MYGSSYVRVFFAWNRPFAVPSVYSWQSLFSPPKLGRITHTTRQEYPGLVFSLNRLSFDDRSGRASGINTPRRCCNNNRFSSMIHIHIPPPSGWPHEISFRVTLSTAEMHKVDTVTQRVIISLPSLRADTPNEITYTEPEPLRRTGISSITSQILFRAHITGKPESAMADRIRVDNQLPDLICHRTNFFQKIRFLKLGYINICYNSLTLARTAQCKALFRSQTGSLILIPR